MNKHEAIEFGESRLGLFGGKMEEFIKLSVEELKKQDNAKKHADEAFYKAIKALQQPVLDKVRAEIIKVKCKKNIGVWECLDIIDKYRAESEEV
jgi:hypothetical protein